jgi:hypothetical protein
VHALAAPILLPVRTRYLIHPTLGSQFHVNVNLDDSMSQQSLIIVNSPNVFVAGFFRVIRELEAQPIPEHVRFLSPSWTDVMLTRIDARTLRLRPDRPYLVNPFDELFHGRHHEMMLGDKIRLTGMTIAVTTLSDEGLPAEVTFTLDVPLEDSSLRWLQWKDGHYRPFQPPIIGQSVRLRIKG